MLVIVEPCDAGSNVRPAGEDFAPGVAVLEAGMPVSPRPMIRALGREAGVDIDLVGPVADRIEAIGAALDRARDHDLVLTSGRVSGGDYDLVRSALERRGLGFAEDKHFFVPAFQLLLPPDEAILPSLQGCDGSLKALPAERLVFEALRHDDAGNPIRINVVINARAEQARLGSVSSLDEAHSIAPASF